MFKPPTSCGEGSVSTDAGSAYLRELCLAILAIFQFVMYVTKVSYMVLYVGKWDGGDGKEVRNEIFLLYIAFAFFVVCVRDLPR